MRDLILRLRSNQPIGTKALTPTGAAEHGANRLRQGYRAEMLVEESRMLQVSIFETLQKNLAFIDYTVVLVGVMTIVLIPVMWALDSSDVGRRRSEATLVVS